MTHPHLTSPHQVGPQDALVHGSGNPPASHLRLAMLAGFAAATVLAALTPTASVADARWDRQRTPVAGRVFYGDLDLNTASGARTMLLRMRAAVVRACALPTSPTLPTASAETSRCERLALARAVRSLNAPLVNTAYARLYPIPPTLTATR